MNPARWELVGRLLDEALALPPGDRVSFVETSAGDDDELRDELLTLLEASQGADEYLSDLRDDVLGPDIHAALEDVLDVEDVTDPWIGRSISHYRILGRLGGGGMGIVYRARDSRLGRQVAMKFIAPEISRDPEAKQRFLLEARTASSLDHPNICTIHDVSEMGDGRLFIVMALYEGETLRTRLKRGRMSVSETPDIGAQIASALDAAHARGIVHRDVKPANVLITDEGVVKLLDFGLALTDDGLSRTGGLKGTVAYMSPEQARGDRADERSDVWAAGVMLYEMLLHEHPFSAEHPQAAIRRILTHEPDGYPELRTLSPDIERVVRAALSKEPASRLPNGGALLAALRGNAVVTGRATSERQVRVPRFLIGAVAGTVLIAIAAVALQRAGGQTEAVSGGLSVSRILWVDDNPENNAEVILELEDMGVEVATAVSTADAVARYDSGVFQLVLSDMGRYEGPGEEYEGRAGFLLLDQLQRVDPDVRVAFCTSLRALARHREEALEAGAVGTYGDCANILSLLDP